MKYNQDPSLTYKAPRRSNIVRTGIGAALLATAASLVACSSTQHESVKPNQSTSTWRDPNTQPTPDTPSQVANQQPNLASLHNDLVRIIARDFNTTASELNAQPYSGPNYPGDAAELDSGNVTTPSVAPQISLISKSGKSLNSYDGLVTTTVVDGRPSAIYVNDNNVEVLVTGTRNDDYMLVLLNNTETPTPTLESFALDIANAAAPFYINAPAPAGS